MSADLGEHTIRDINLDDLVTAFKTTTAAGADALKKRLLNPLTDKPELQERQAQLRDIRKRCKTSEREITETLQVLHDHEENVVTVGNAGNDKRLKEYYTQILWPTDSFAARLNHIGWITEVVVFLRTIFLPGMAAILPLFVLAAPLVLYTFVLKKPLSMTEYFGMIQSSLKKAVPSVLGAPRFAGKGGWMESGEQIVHILVSVGMFVMSIWNQVSAATHMRSIVADMRMRADSVIRFTEAIKKLGDIMGIKVDVGVAWSPGSLGVFGDAWNDPTRIHRILEQAGELDMLATVALQKRVCFPKYADSLAIRDLYHPSLSKEKRVYNSVSMKDKQHILVTGPNRGGKSTFLKSMGAAVLMSQTLGIVFARSASVPIFDTIITALAPSDTLGKMSLFEAEIEFAKNVKSVIATTTGPVFLMMDEIFHGTNAHDGVEASHVFLDELYATKSPVFSIVSTHYMELPARYGKEKTLNLCMEASVDKEDPDRLIYTYRLIEGTNQFSSVREILRERGLLVQKQPTTVGIKNV
jgi:energy-coupling factor transporter ATP-binding protein EcfA2